MGWAERANKYSNYNKIHHANIYEPKPIKQEIPESMKQVEPVPVKQDNVFIKLLKWTIK